MPFNLSQFVIQKAVLEIRYANALLLWDRAGSIWSKIQRLHPDLKLKSVQPNQVMIELPENIEAYVGIDKAFITAFFPGTDLKPLKELAKLLFANLFESLDIADLSRIGLRLFFEQVFKERETLRRIRIQ